LSSSVSVRSKSRAARTWCRWAGKMPKGGSPLWPPQTGQSGLPLRAVAVATVAAGRVHHLSSVVAMSNRTTCLAIAVLVLGTLNASTPLAQVRARVRGIQDDPRRTIESRLLPDDQVVIVSRPEGVAAVRVQSVSKKEVIEEVALGSDAIVVVECKRVDSVVTENGSTDAVRDPSREHRSPDRRFSRLTGPLFGLCLKNRDKRPRTAPVTRVLLWKMLQKQRLLLPNLEEVGNEPHKKSKK